MKQLEAWVIESQRRGEELVVILLNKATKEEVETTMNPKFVALLVRPKGA